MPEPTRQETIARAIARESVPGVTPEGVNVESVAYQMREANNNASWREALTVAREPVIDARKLGEKIEQIGYSRDPVTNEKTRPGAEGTRHTKAKNAGDMIIRYLRYGYEDVPGSTVSAHDRTTIEDEARAAIMKVPRLAAEYKSLPPAEKLKMIRDVIKEPAFAKQLRETVKRMAEMPDIPDVVSESEEKLKEKEAEALVKQSEIDDAQRRLDALELRLADYTGPAVGAPAPASRAHEIGQRAAVYGNLSAKEAELATTIAKRDGLKEDLAIIYRNMKAVGAAYVGTDPIAVQGEISNANTRIATLHGEITPLRSRLSVIDTYVREQHDLENQQTALLKEKRDRQAEKTKVDGQVRTLKRQFEDAKNLRESMEMNIVNGLEGAFNEAASEALNARIEALGRHFDDELTKLKGEATTDAARNFYDTYMRRMQTDRPRRRWFGLINDHRRALNEANINDLYGNLMTGGPDNAMVGIITGMANPSNPGHNYSEAEARELMKSEDFQKARPGFIKDILSRRLILNGIGPEDVYTITTSPWGQDAITQAYNTNENFQKNLRAAFGQDALKQPGFWTRFATEAGTWQRLLLMMLGIGIPYVAVRAREAGRLNNSIIGPTGQIK